jgi:hypothetical protein
MRARSLKPSLFKNELLAVADPLCTVVFAGLWCLADREGRLEDRPARIHFDVNPGRAFEGTCRAIDWLAANGFVIRYEADGRKLIQVVNFTKHQNPHCKEAPSTIPAPCEHSASTVVAGLTPDSGLLTPDSGLLTAHPPGKPGKNGARAPRTATATRIPDNWTPSPDLIAYAEERLPGVDVDTLTEAFRDYWMAAADAKARKADWSATWRTWVRRDADRGQYPRRAAAPSPDRPDCPATLPNGQPNPVVRVRGRDVRQYIIGPGGQIGTNPEAVQWQ